ncbi:hypothetical protein H4R34_003129 [Dimargaris verticillata]|uniref:Homeobox domain-containing protein n=1 Tax=Dimargaris verticillata TaxID=2761393 RepID=A0A9W8B846_9FUNG|nr:hypothetical protein H4R34_003129 [Dimargaris verticillata]
MAPQLSPSAPGFKRRYRASPSQVRLLESFFNQDETPDGMKRDFIAQHANMPAKSVHIWFQNRRAKKNLELRKSGKPIPPRYPSMHNFKRFLSLPNTYIFCTAAGSKLIAGGEAQQQPPAYELPLDIATASTPALSPCTSQLSSPRTSPEPAEKHALAVSYPSPPGSTPMTPKHTTTVTATHAYLSPSSSLTPSPSASPVQLPAALPRFSHMVPDLSPANQSYKMNVHYLLT